LKDAATLASANPSVSSKGSVATPRKNFLAEAQLVMFSTLPRTIAQIPRPSKGRARSRKENKGESSLRNTIDRPLGVTTLYYLSNAFF
jgi:hypothetical protein